MLSRKHLPWWPCVSMDQISFKGIYFCPKEINSGLTDSGQCQLLTGLKGPKRGTYMRKTIFFALRFCKIVLSFAIILLSKRELVALLYLGFCCRVTICVLCFPHGLVQ